ncbi:MAG: CBS domain-containing protein [Deltaproteobacteria bacterium]|nr:CBS domain-containing protein [Deltaproteobacteria bacterium]
MNALDFPVDNYMTQPVVTMPADDDVSAADALLAKHRVSSLLVVGRDGSAAGVISRMDLLRLGRVRAWNRIERPLLELPAACVADAMSHPVVSVRPGATVAEAARAMLARHIHRVFVVDDGRPVGVLSTRDVMMAVMEARIPGALSTIMTPEVLSIDVGQTLEGAMARLAQTSVGGLVVTEDDKPVGLFTQVEALASRGLPPETRVEEAMTQALLCLPDDTVLYRAAGFTVSTHARRIIVVHHHTMKGVVTGFDFVRLAAGATPPKRDAAQS